jgi:hypothetical protein
VSQKCFGGVSCSCPVVVVLSAHSSIFSSPLEALE